MTMTNSRNGAFILVLTFMMILTAISGLHTVAAQEYQGTHVNLEIPNNEYWSENIAFYDPGDRFQFFVVELDSRLIDVYILDAEQLDLYDSNLPFTAEYENENSATTGIVNWTCPDDGFYYLVVDNKKNAHLLDAYAMEDVIVDISWINRTEQREYEQFEEITDDFSLIAMACCASMIIIPISVIVVIIVLSRKKPQHMYYGPPLYPPMYPPYGPPQPPFPQQFSYQGPPNQPYPPRYPPQGPPNPQYPPQYPPQGPPSPPDQDDGASKDQPRGPRIVKDTPREKDEDVIWE